LWKFRFILLKKLLKICWLSLNLDWRGIGANIQPFPRFSSPTHCFFLFLRWLLYFSGMSCWERERTKTLFFFGWIDRDCGCWELTAKMGVVGGEAVVKEGWAMKRLWWTVVDLEFLCGWWVYWLSSVTAAKVFDAARGSGLIVWWFWSAISSWLRGFVVRS